MSASIIKYWYWF